MTRSYFRFLFRDDVTSGGNVADDFSGLDDDFLALTGLAYITDVKKILSYEKQKTVLEFNWFFPPKMYKKIKLVTEIPFFQFLPLNIFFGWDFPGSCSHWGGVSDFDLDDFSSDLTQHVALAVVSHVVVQEILGEDDP